jgi:DNA modification methylase
VLDPFCGSGTTGVACIELGREFIGVEAGDWFAEQARNRLALHPIDGDDIRNAGLPVG